jgi:uncharacterized membrane protein
MKQPLYSALSGFIFLVVAIVHLVRAVLGWQLLIGSWIVPIWISWAGAVVATFLAYEGFKHSRAR